MGQTEKPAKTPDLKASLGIEIRSIGIPPRPVVLERIEQEMRGDNPNFNALGDIISSDVGISASLLKISNSSLFGFRGKIRSVQDAIIVLGLDTVARTISGLSLRETFKHVPNMERFWDASSLTAHIAFWLAKHLNLAHRVRPEEAFTFALFRDCGIPILMVPFPNYEDVLKIANEEPILPFTDIEDDMIGLNHALVGAKLATEWLFPDEFAQAIAHHHHRPAIDGSSPDLIPEIATQFIAIAQLSERFSQRLTGMNQTREWDKLGSACLSVLNLQDDDVERLYDDCNVELNS